MNIVCDVYSVVRSDACDVSCTMRSQDKLLDMLKFMKTSDYI